MSRTAENQLLTSRIPTERRPRGPQVTGAEPTRPGQVWGLLTPAQQQTAFQAIGVVCRNLVDRAARAGDQEGPNERR